MAPSKTARKPAQKSPAKSGKSPALKGYESKLRTMREEIMGSYRRDLKASQHPDVDGADDIVDRANNAYNREFLLSLSGTERDLLKQVDEAIARIDEGRFGYCTHCEDKIPQARLRAVPWASYCIDCQEQVEQGLTLDS